MITNSENRTAKKSAPTFPRLPLESTYRLQFHAGFTFRDAQKIIPYLRDLGITHVYASPYLKSRSGSTHGYDIVDHQQLNPEIGTPEEHDALVATLHDHGMGLILDIVPNHMGIASNDNKWWNNVLENGPASPYAGYFDIAWKATARPELQDKVLLPVLGDPYGKALETGLLRLAFEAGRFTIRCYERIFPVAPRSYALILGHRIEDLEALLVTEPENLAEYHSILTSIRNLPDRTETDTQRVIERQREKEIVKRRLAELVARSEATKQFIESNVALFNGMPGVAKSLDLLDDLLSHQSYRLAFWRVALEEINYRRFFDINDLAALSVEREEVFSGVHETIFRLIAEGKVDGLRVDHPDGLYDPREYFERLKQRGIEYVVAEKILGLGEAIPENWPIAGTTGYEFLNAVNGLFVNRASEGAFSRIYREFTGESDSLLEIVYRSKRLTLVASLAGELNALAFQLDRLAQRWRHSRDFTLNGLRGALREVIACFPVYRSYISAEGVSASDRKYVEIATRRAAAKNPTMSGAIFRFLREMILLEYPSDATAEEKEEQVRFVGKFQQVTSPVMAKGLEDTSFYIFNRFVSLNEVGGDPNVFGLSPDALHRTLASKRDRFPRGLSALSTHDTKRSEDVRARINCLSEIPDEWGENVRRWGELNATLKSKIDDVAVPDANEEYALYQNILGVWPTVLEVPKEDFIDRIAAFAVKSLHEAKVHSSWINPNQAYDTAVEEFVRRILNPATGGAFIEDQRTFRKRISRGGAINSLAQTLLKIASPGVPDTYQGTELLDFSLVDPDNRRAIDYEIRKQMLKELQNANDFQSLTKSLMRTLEDGRAKLFLTWRALTVRRDHSGLFAEGEYLPLIFVGPLASHLFGFVRRWNGNSAIVVVPRFSISNDSETRVEFPDLKACDSWRNVFTDQLMNPMNGAFPVSELFADFPVALLLLEPK